MDEFDDNEIPIGWEEVRLTNEEIDALCEAADSGDHSEAGRIVDGAYDRLFGEFLN